MPLIRSKSRLIIEAVATDNPDLPFVPTLDNCYVYGLQTNKAKKSTVTIQGRFGTGYRGKHVVQFNKLDVAILTLNCDRDVINNGGHSTLAYLEEINRRYGFDLKPTEVQDIPVMNSGTICRLTVQPEALMFTGTVDFLIKQALPELPQLITNRDIDPVFNPNGIGLSISGSMLTRGHDYSEVEPVLTPITGVLDAATATTLSTALKSVDTVPWGIVAGTLYSLVDATVQYNGPVVGVPTELQLGKLVIPGYDNVLVLTPSAVDTGLTATPIVIHYNIYTTIRS